MPDVDVPVNALGFLGARPALKITDEEWRRYFEVNVLASEMTGGALGVDGGYVDAILP